MLAGLQSLASSLNQIANRAGTPPKVNPMRSRSNGHADDAGQVPALLGQAEGTIAFVTADGAYDGEPMYAAAAARQRHPSPDVVVPPRASAVPSSDKGDSLPQSPRDRHIQLMAERGRRGWQKATGYGRRNQAETAMARYKHLIDPKLRARSLPVQQGEVAIAVAALTRRSERQSPPPSASHDHRTGRVTSASARSLHQRLSTRVPV